MLSEMPRKMSWGACEQAFGRAGNWGEGKRKFLSAIVGDRSAVDLFVLVFGASRSGEVMIVSVPFAFQVRSLQGLVELETELARRTARGAQVKQLKSEKLSPCTRGNLVQRCLGHCQPARSYFLKRQRLAPY